MPSRPVQAHHLIGNIALCTLLICAWPAMAGFLHDFDLPQPPQVSEVRPTTLQQALDRYAPKVGPALESRFNAAGVPYPPEALTLIALKAEMRLELWAYHGGQRQYIDSYPIRDASGLPGPKRRRGDHQVPEGIYRIDAFNPNSSYHLSMRLDYPNRFDRQMGYLDHRSDLGYNIFIHGGAASRGCLAMGDPAIEELFVLVAEVGKDNTRVIIAPHDPRARSIFPIPRGLPDWTNALYEMLDSAIGQYVQPLPQQPEWPDPKPVPEYADRYEVRLPADYWPGDGNTSR